MPCCSRHGVCPCLRSGARRCGPSTVRSSLTPRVVFGTGTTFSATYAASGRVRDFEWLTTHTYRKTVASTLDEAGISGRQVADQLGHSRVSMTQDTYLDRRPVNENNLRALEAIDPDVTESDEGDGGEDELTVEAGS
ncbi:tyrosine-type recombinase/integrase [Nocardioides sp. YJ-D4]